jgi:AcrR family transcriptional regulator
MDLKPLSPDAASPSYHHGNLREALVLQGLSSLEASDKADVSLRELARQVGVSANAVYRHFANKEALLAALAAEGFRRLYAAQVQAAMAGPDMKKGMHQAGRAYVQFAQDNPALFRLMFSRLTSSHATDELKEAANASFETLQTAAAQLEGLPLTDPQVTVSAMAAWSLVHGLSHLALDDQLAPYTEGRSTFIDEVIGRFGWP